jgi:succinate dehydrogenase / fumarate reductase flavoprotein subunit
MKIFPGMHYTMGGLWVDYNQATTIPGLYACGECDYSIHGANRLGANSLMSCIYGGFVAGPEAIKYARNTNGEVDTGCFDAEKKRQEEFNQRLLKSDGTENPFQIWRELGQVMTKNCTVIRYNKNLAETDPKIVELLERWNHINLSDKSMWTNSTFTFARQLYNMLQLARVIVKGALLRNESRGAHYKPELPERDDANFLKTSIAHFAPDADEPQFEWQAVDTGLIKPRIRKY